MTLACTELASFVPGWATPGECELASMSCRLVEEARSSGNIQPASDVRYRRGLFPIVVLPCDSCETRQTLALSSSEYVLFWKQIRGAGDALFA